jgi:hypothetical protein
MTLPAPVSLSGFSLRLTKRTASVVINRKAITSQLLAVSLICALCLQCVLVPRVAIARLSPNAKTTAADKRVAEKEAANKVTSEVTSEVTNNGASSNEASETPAVGDPLPATITDAVVSKHKPTLISGRIEGTLRVLLGEPFTINGTNQITADLYLPGTPAIQLSGAARYAGTVSDGGVTVRRTTTLLEWRCDLPGRIHTNIDPILPHGLSGLIRRRRNADAQSSQSDIAGIGLADSARSSVNRKDSRLTSRPVTRHLHRQR